MASYLCESLILHYPLTPATVLQAQSLNYTIFSYPFSVPFIFCWGPGSFSYLSLCIKPLQNLMAYNGDTHLFAQDFIIQARLGRYSSSSPHVALARVAGAGKFTYKMAHSYDWQLVLVVVQEFSQGYWPRALILLQVGCQGFHAAWRLGSKRQEAEAATPLKA